MQTIIQVISRRTESLRERIVNDTEVRAYGLWVDAEKK